MMNSQFFSVDIEDWFQVENLKEAISKNDWPNIQLRVRENTIKMLNLLEKHNTKATFFVLGWIAEREKELIRNIYSRGHEIASHGYGHDLVYKLSHLEFREDIRKSKDIIEEIIQDRIYGYRAPSFSITDWALDILKEEGYIYDSSLFLVSNHDRYSKVDISLEGTNFIRVLPNGLKEVPISTNKFFAKSLPWGGGGYFRILPYHIFKQGYIRSRNQSNGLIFYCHPWEIDADQPRVSNIKLSYQFRHYYGLESTERKLSRLLEDFKFTSVINGIKDGVK